MKIGPIDIDPPVVLAPMAGVTNAPFRQLCRRQGRGLYVSEMITARALVEGNARTLRMIEPARGESPRSIQLYGVDPDVIGAAVRRLVGGMDGGEDSPVDHIDLNFGCPAPKVTRKGGGAALPAHPVLFARIVAAAVRAAGAVPVTVKLRTGIDGATPTARRAGLLAEQEGAAAVILHARSAEQRYSGRADWNAIGELKAAVETIPVLGNGDIWEAGDAVALMAATGCDGVVIGRGCLGRPWLFAELEAAFDGRPIPPPPRLGEVAAAMLEHARLLAAYLGAEKGVRDFRRHVGWYLTGYAVGGQARQALSHVSDIAELEETLSRLDPAAELPDGARRLPRGHTDGPRPVSLPAGWLARVEDPDPPAGGDVFVSGG